MRRPSFGVIAPHPPIMVEQVGGARSAVTVASSEAMLRVTEALRRYDPETIVVMSPHAPSSMRQFIVDDALGFEGSLADFGDSRLARFPGDPELARAVVDALATAGHPAGTRSALDGRRSGWLDHGTLVPLSFLDPNGTRRLVVVSLASQPYHEHRAVGEAVAAASEKLGRRTAFVASGDLSHRLTPDAPAGFSPHARRLDATIVGLVEQGRFLSLPDIDPLLIEQGGECGLRSLIAMGGYCCDDPAPTRVLAYEGPWGVGYLTALVGRDALEIDDAIRAEQRGSKGGCAGEEETRIVQLARDTIARRLGAPVVRRDPPELTDHAYPARAGVFVSLHHEGALRGCIGTIAASHGRLRDEVRENALQAAFSDPRFPPLTLEELAGLDISVDVLHQPEPCTPADLDPAEYGVIVTAGARRGLLLPNLEGIDDAETQVAIARRKAGIAEGEEITLQRFRVERYT